MKPVVQGGSGGYERQGPRVGRGGEVAQEHRGHAGGVGLGLVCDWSGEQAVDAGLEELEPAVEVGGGERDPLVDTAVDVHRLSAVLAGPEQDLLPERGDDRQVLAQIQAHLVDEDGPQDRVGEGLAVEGGQELVEVGAAGDVAHRGPSSARRRRAGPGRCAGQCRRGA